MYLVARFNVENITLANYLDKKLLLLAEVFL